MNPEYGSSVHTMPNYQLKVTGDCVLCGELGRELQTLTILVNCVVFCFPVRGADFLLINLA